jgi:hypothetical protein
MALMLGSKEKISSLCDNIYTNIPKIIIDVIIILNSYYFQILPCMYWYQANIRLKSYWFSQFFDTIINVSLYTMVPTWCPPQHWKNLSNEHKGFGQFFIYIYIENMIFINVGWLFSLAS